MSGGTAWFQAEKDAIRRRLFKYIWRAFSMIPPADGLRVLDAGCGSGVSSIELAKLADCKITCIDIDRGMLDLLRRKVAGEGLEERIEVIELSLFDMKFPDGSFDVILAEGSIYAIGFERGLKEWKRFLKAGGFILLHDSQAGIEQKIGTITASGYELQDYFLLGTDVWRDEYFTPLEGLVAEAGKRYAGEPGVIEAVKEAEWEIETFKNNPEENSSVCFVIRKPA
jgi:ubiquinone/menaquinone biosynthesis C-methylase UbiE